ncbi:MAG: tRNA (guanosine(37)-N1)-methyltransferase TrmD [Candidatus Paceibacterota bacterium]
MVFHLVTIFPEAIKSYFDSSILKRAQEKKMVKIKFYNPRDFAKDKHKRVDDKPFGGGPGMVMKIEPLVKVIQFVISKIKPARQQGGSQKSKIIILAPTGKQFTQKMAQDFAKKYKNIILISGHYEGIDERVAKIFKAEKISVGPYVLTGGELAAGVVIDAVSRHIPGVLGKAESLEEKRGALGLQVYTRPEVFKWRGKKYRVPKVLLSGNHKKIEEWKRLTH